MSQRSDKLVTLLKELFQLDQPERLVDAEEKARSLGADPDETPNVLELRSRLEEATAGMVALEAQVIDHLHAFRGDNNLENLKEPGAIWTARSSRRTSTT